MNIKNLTKYFKAKNLEIAAAWFLMGGLLFLVLSIIYFLIFAGIAYKPSMFSASTTGDIGSFFSGTLGTLFSFVSVIFFYSALKLQRKELRLQRKELSETRFVFESQQFENTFFNLLSIQENIRQRIFENSSKVTINKSNKLQASTEDNTQPEFSGLYNAFLSDCKLFELDYLQKRYGVQIATIGNTNALPWANFEDFALKEYNIELNQLQDNLTRKKWIYNRFFNIFQRTIGHYFRNLYHILKLVYDNELAYLKNNEDVNKEEAHAKFKRYANFVHAQMSTDELGLFFYNCLLYDKTKRLVHHYNLVDNLCREDLAHLDDESFYSHPVPIDNEQMSPIHLKTREK